MIGVLGSINLDLVALSDRLPLPGETLAGNSFITAPGGKGANQALAARRAGATVFMSGAVGSNDFAVQAVAELSGAGVDLTRVRKRSGATGVAIIIVDKRGENQIVVVPGANASVDEQMARSSVSDLQAGDFLLVQQEIPAPAIAAALELSRQKGITSILNIAPITPQTSQLAQGAAIIVANQTEFASLSGEEGTSGDIAQRAANWAKRHGKTLIVTLGAAGAIAATANERIEIAALPVVPVDTVGAGDTFCGYLGAGLDRGLGLEAALRRAVVAGSLACLKPGAQSAIPGYGEVEAALAAG